MNTTITVEQRLLDEIRKLSSEKIIEVDDCIDFLYQRQKDSDDNLAVDSSKVSEASFSKVWDNPEDAKYNEL
jgi:hypothetical protein